MIKNILIGGLSNKSSQSLFYNILDKDTNIFNTPENIKKEKDIICQHSLCPKCLGTGINQIDYNNPVQCIHMLSCNCKRCSSYFIKNSNNYNFK